MYQPQNFLKRLLDAGVVTQDDLEQVPTNELRKLLMPGDSGGFVRNETEGGTMALNGQPGGAFDSVPMAPRPQSGGAYPDQVSRGMDRAQPQIDPQSMAPQQPRQVPIKMAGFGNDGIMSDLGSTTGPVPQLDMGRGAVDTPRGKGYYGKDGAVYVAGPEGYTKIVMGYDRNASMAMNKADLERRRGEQDITQSQASVAHTQEQIAASQALRNQKEGIPGMGVPQSLLEKQFGKAPEGQRWTMQGTLEDVPGSNGKLTEFQGKSEAFGTRAAAAHEVLNAIGQDGKIQPGYIKRAAESVPVIGGALGTLTNATQSAPQQQIEQAQRDFVNATLRQESGATINPNEFDNAQKQYFPQPGDSPDVIAQKKRNRELVIASFGDSAGPGKKKVVDAGSRARALFEAKAAIRQGADAAAVKRRLAENGITDAL